MLIKILVKFKNALRTKKFKCVLASLSLLFYFYYKSRNKYSLVYLENDLNNFVIKRLLEKIRGYSPTFYVLSPVMSAICMKLKRKPRIAYHNQIMKAEDGGEFSVDLYPRTFFGMEDKVPIVFFNCGLEGDSTEVYALV